MKEVEGKKYYTAAELSPLIGRSYSTIVAWYDAEKMAKDNNMPFEGELPEIRRDFDLKRTRYWCEDDIPKLIKFRDEIKPGDLSYYNKRIMWGVRGKEILEKERKEKERIDGEKEISDKEKESQTKREGN